MRILHINDIAYVGSTLVAAQRDAGHEASLLDPAKPGAALRYPWKVLSLPLRVVPIISTAIAIRRRRPDVVHVHYATQALPALLAGRPYLVHCHGSDVRGVRPGSAAGRLLGLLLRRAGAVLFATPDLAPWVRAYRPDAAFLPNPVDVEAFAPRPAEDRASFEAGPRDLLVATKAEAVKGIDETLAILRLVREARPATSVTVVSHGTRAAEVIAAAGPDAEVQPPIPHDEMPDLVRDHRVALGQFAVGAMGQLELETLAAGVPVVTRFAFAAAYEVPPPLVAADTATDAAASITALLDDDELRELTSLAGREWVVAQHAPAAIVARLDGIYASLR